MPIAMVLALALGQAAPAQPETVILFHAERLDADPVLMRGALAEDIQNWTSAADYPSAARAAGQKGEARAMIGINASGVMTECRPDPGAALFTATICPLLKRHARFRHALDREGNPVADRIALRAVFGPKPPPPPPVYPSRWGTDLQLIVNKSNMRLTREPDWARFAPADPRKGEVAVALYVSAFRPDGSFHLICGVLGTRTGDALERATCDGLKSASFAFISDPGLMTLLVRWEGKRATVILPSRSGKSLEFLAPERTRGGPELTGTAQVDLRFPADGTHPVCRVTGSAGSDAADIAACRFFESQPYSPAIDIFGRKIEGRLPYSLSFMP
nr:hypothetical protein [uncultured Sphingomonas sp.]